MTTTTKKNIMSHPMILLGLGLLALIVVYTAGRINGATSILIENNNKLHSIITQSNNKEDFVRQLLRGGMKNDNDSTPMTTLTLNVNGSSP